jgi:hypothetical protein
VNDGRERPDWSGSHGRRNLIVRRPRHLVAVVSAIVDELGVQRVVRLRMRIP